jgi:hypothetical protein
MIQAAIEFFFIFWYYLAEILLIERILRGVGVDPHSKKVHHVILAHVIQIVLVVLIIWGLIIFYLTFIKFGLYI